jgi:hypothetical protein
MLSISAVWSAEIALGTIASVSRGSIIAALTVPA